VLTGYAFLIDMSFTLRYPAVREFTKSIHLFINTKHFQIAHMETLTNEKKLKMLELLLNYQYLVYTTL